MALGRPRLNGYGRQLSADGVLRQGWSVAAALVALQVSRQSMDEGPGVGNGSDPEARWTRSSRLQGERGGRCEVWADPAGRADAGARERERGGGPVGQRGRAGGLRGQGVRVQGPSGALGGARDQRPDHAPVARAPAGPALLAVAANAPIAPRQAPVDQVFGTLKRSYGYRTVRYLGLARNALELRVMCLTYNLRRAAINRRLVPIGPPRAPMPQ